MNKMVFTLFAVFLFRISSRSYVFGIEGLPNVVLLVVDNVGISDLGWFGNATVETPNLARLASEGVKFTRWYSQSTSTSSRASILTGNLPIRTGIVFCRCSLDISFFGRKLNAQITVCVSEIRSLDPHSTIHLRRAKTSSVLEDRVVGGP